MIKRDTRDSENGIRAMETAARRRLDPGVIIVNLDGSENATPGIAAPLIDMASLATYLKYRSEAKCPAYYPIHILIEDE